MQYRLNELALLALAGSALAHQPHQHKHAKLHERRLAPAPYGLGNSTFYGNSTAGGAPVAPQDSTLTQVLTATVHPVATGAASPVQAAEVDAASVSANRPAAALDAADEVCEEVTVTVTNAPVTITVTAAAGGQASSAASSYVAPVPSSVATAPSSFVLPGSSSVIEVSTKASSSSVYVAPSSAPAAPVPAAETSASAEAVHSSSVYVAPTSQASSSAPATTVVASSSVAPVSSSSTSSSAAATSSSATTSVTGVTDKRGLVYNTFSGVVDQFTSSQISWGWNWAQTPGGSMPDGVEFVPILWGNRESEDLANWKSNAEEQISSGCKHLMGFNEPDVDAAGGGSNLAADVAASVYKEYLNDFGSKVSLVSPGVCNGEGLRESTGRNQGLDWLQDFHDACGGFTESGCKVDKINIHWYSSYQGDLDSVVSYFKEYVQKAHTKFNMNLWITEYQLQNADESVQEKFISQTSEWMSSQTYIERYSYFKAETIVGSGNLMSAYTS